MEHLGHEPSPIRDANIASGGFFLIHYTKVLDLMHCTFKPTCINYKIKVILSLNYFHLCIVRIVKDYNITKITEETSPLILSTEVEWRGADADSLMCSGYAVYTWRIIVLCPISVSIL